MAKKRQISADEAKQVGTTLGVDWKNDPGTADWRLNWSMARGIHRLNVTNDDLKLTGTLLAHLKEFPGLRRA